MDYKIVNASEQELIIIKNVIEFIHENYNKVIDIGKLRVIEIVDELDNDSSGRSIKDKIILPRKYGLEGVECKEKISNYELVDNHLKMLISTIFHELWHVTTWEKYEKMYQYVLDEKSEDIYLVFAYMYWIEYIAHVESVYMEVDVVMREFCENFVHRNWHKIDCGYSYFIKALPYYLARANYLKIFERLSKEIKCEELKVATYDFDRESRRLYNDNSITDEEKAKIIRGKIECLFE